MNAHDRARRLVSARLDGPLSPDETEAMGRHLAACAACRRFAAQSETLGRDLRALPHLPPSPAVSRQVLERIGDGQSLWGRLARGLQFASSPALTVASAVVLVAALAVTVLLAFDPGNDRVVAPTVGANLAQSLPTMAPSATAPAAATATATATEQVAAGVVTPTATARVLATVPAPVPPTATGVAAPSPTPVINVQFDEPTQAPPPTAVPLPATEPPPTLAPPTPTPVVVKVRAPDPTATAVPSPPPVVANVPPATAAAAAIARAERPTPTAMPTSERVVAAALAPTEVVGGDPDVAVNAPPIIPAAGSSVVTDDERDPDLAAAAVPTIVIDEPAGDGEVAVAGIEPPPAVFAPESPAESPTDEVAAARTTRARDEQLAVATPVALEEPAFVDEVGDATVVDPDLGAKIRATVAAKVPAAGNGNDNSDRERGGGQDDRSGSGSGNGNRNGNGNDDDDEKTANRGRDDEKASDDERGRGGRDQDETSKRDQAPDRAADRERQGRLTGGRGIAIAGAEIVDPNLGASIRATVAAGMMDVADAGGAAPASDADLADSDAAATSVDGPVVSEQELPTIGPAAEPGGADLGASPTETAASDDAAAPRAATMIAAPEDGWSESQ